MSLEINSLTSAYTDYINSVAGTAKTAQTLQNTSNLTNADDQELMEACKSFEAYFMEQVFKEMWKTVGTEESDSGAMNTLTSYFKDEFIGEMATQSTETNSTGLAQMLYEQMKRTNVDL